MLKKAFLLAAGRGERLRPLTDKTPKPLLEVKGLPILEHILKKLEAEGFQEVVINAWHLKEQIQTFVQAFSKRSKMKLQVSLENELLGTGGGLKKALKLLIPSAVFEPILMLNGDCLWEGELQAFCQRALARKDAEACWWLTDESPDQTIIEVEGRRIVKIGQVWRAEQTASGSEKAKRGCFSGIQVIRKMKAEDLPDAGCIIRNYWVQRLSNASVLEADFQGLKSWVDIGTPERYEKIKV